MSTSASEKSSISLNFKFRGKTLEYHCVDIYVITDLRNVIKLFTSAELIDLRIIFGNHLQAS